MAKELEEFNAKAGNSKEALFTELKQVDPANSKNVDEAELAKRRNILKGVKAAI